MDELLRSPRVLIFKMKHNIYLEYTGGNDDLLRYRRGLICWPGDSRRNREILTCLFWHQKADPVLFSYVSTRVTLGVCIEIGPGLAN